MKREIDCQCDKAICSGGKVVKKIKIKIIKLGKQKHEKLFCRLEKYRSELFSVDIFEKSCSDCDYEWGYTFNTLERLLTEGYNSSTYDMCIGFTDTIIERNYYGRRLKGNNIYIVSFYQVSDLLKKENIDVFNFMLAIIYRYVTRYNLGKYLTHDETKGCLFDMCGDKRDIVYLATAPFICEECMIKLETSSVDMKYMQILEKEIKHIHKAHYYKIVDFIKAYPYVSLGIGIITTIVIDIVSDFVFEYIKNLF